MRYEFFIALRYLITKQRERFLSLISIIAILGIAIGVACIIVVQAVMAGFDKELKDKIVGANAHILVESNAPMEDYKVVMDEVKHFPEVLESSPFIMGQTILQRGKSTRGVVVRGIEPKKETKVTQIKKYLKAGKLPGVGGVLVGSELANSFNLDIGNSITMVSPSGGKQYRFAISGIFTSGMYDYDMNLVFTNIHDAKEIFNLGNRVTGIGVRLKDPYHAKRMKRIMQERLGFSFVIRSWMDINKNLFNALKLEKTAMFIILVLIVVVASFNIASTLIMMVTEKVKDIGILKSMGATNKSIHAIFTIEGLLIGVAGTLLGLISGIGFSFLLGRYQIIQLPKDIYYIDKLPIEIQWMDLGLVAVAAIVISFLATVYPAWQASRLEPVEALRYE